MKKENKHTNLREYNTILLLHELSVSALDYLSMLKQEERTRFIREWRHLSTLELDTSALIFEVDRVIASYPSLSAEFQQGGENSKETSRFNPLIASPQENLPTPEPAIVIINHIKTVLIELELTYGILDDKRSSDG
jgi:hypothetical protein